MTTLTPFGDFGAIERRMRRAFEEFGFARALGPAADAYESEKEYIVELEVPGFDEQELNVSVSDHTLAVTGKRKTETEAKDKSLIMRERLESEFERRFILPGASDSKHVTADYTKGVLTVHVPKLRAATTKIPIASK
jgi:HSP20 family protein